MLLLGLTYFNVFTDHRKTRAKRIVEFKPTQRLFALYYFNFISFVLIVKVFELIGH